MPSVAATPMICEIVKRNPSGVGASIVFVSVAVEVTLTALDLRIIRQRLSHQEEIVLLQ